MNRLRWIINGGIAMGVLGLGAVVYGLFGDIPRMIDQPKILAYEARMPLPAPGAVTVEQAPAVQFIRSPDAAALARGKVYYGYYCVQCHGQRGDGHGPVGESYNPAPPDLADPKIQAYDDQRMLQATLSGTGHQLENDGPSIIKTTVPNEHMGYLIAYIRTFAKPQTQPQTRPRQEAR